MYYKLCNSTDVSCLESDIHAMQKNVPKNEYQMILSAFGKVKENVDILCDNYGENRDSEKDLGGYVVFCASTKEEILIDRILNRYGIQESDYEYEEIIVRNSQIMWKNSCYIISSDYAVVIVRPVAITMEKQYILGA